MKKQNQTHHHSFTLSFIFIAKPRYLISHFLKFVDIHLHLHARPETHSKVNGGKEVNSKRKKEAFLFQTGTAGLQRVL